MYTFATLQVFQAGIPDAQLSYGSTPQSALALGSLGIVVLAALAIGLFAGRGERDARPIRGVAEPATA